MRVRLQSVVLVALGLALGGAVTGAFVLYGGFYNISALEQHLPVTYRLLQIGLAESIERRARAVKVPPLGDPAQLARGMTLYAEHCTQCHGAPGVAPAPFALGLTPVPKNLALIARERNAAELYWVVRNGIKMTGMPAWAFRMSDGDLWAVVAAVREIAFMTPAEYAARSRAGTAHRHIEAPADAPADIARGKLALEQYACLTCHQIPGLVGAHAPVGPPLERIGSRQYIAGMLPNTPGNMTQWLMEPQEVNPRSAMPRLGVTERDARDMAAYLYTLKDIADTPRCDERGLPGLCTRRCGVASPRP